MATYQLPHHKLIAYAVAKELYIAVRDTHVRDAGLKDQATPLGEEAHASTAPRVQVASRGQDKARVFAIVARKQARPQRPSRSQR